MKKYLKVTRILASTLLVGFIVLTSCSKDDGPDPVAENETLMLIASKTVISDGESVQFTVSSNSVSVDDATIYVEGVAISNYDHTFAEGGTYNVVAKKDGFTDSEAVAITVNEIAADVYVAGSEYVNGVETATYWKNGVAHHLVSSDFGAKARTIIVHDSDVYVLVEEGYRTIKYWKNDEEHLVHTQANGDAYARDMVITDNGDVYIAGGSTENNIYTAKYWKNGVITKLLHNNVSGATGIAVNGNDVYVSGYSSDANTMDDIPTALYWKNGVPVVLSDGSVRTRANKIAFSGNDVHVTGSVADGTAKEWAAKYWVNGVETNLVNGQEASHIYIDGSDVYITGRGSGLMYWKNGEPTTIAADSFIYGITVFNNTVYTAGSSWNSETDITKAGYWKNTTFTALAEGTKSPNAYSIAVVAQ